MPALTAKDINLRLKAVPDWSKRAKTICRTFKFDGFMTSIAFVRRIAKQAQKNNHHPDIDIRFDQVTLTLTTHDEGGITEKDFSLARQCDEVYSRLSISWPTQIAGQSH
jgi:4a-hydroxytetrahydrobiopterin dehydratase